MNEELRQAQQRQLTRLAELEAQGESVGGWKLGQTSGESRDAFGPGVRPFGFILTSRILADGAELSWAEVGNGGIENEVCFRCHQSFLHDNLHLSRSVPHTNLVSFNNCFKFRF